MKRCSATGTRIRGGSRYTGGLVGQMDLGDVVGADERRMESSYVKDLDMQVEPGSQVRAGGLIGEMSQVDRSAPVGSANLMHSYAHGSLTITGSSGVAGGLVGHLKKGDGFLLPMPG